MQARQLHSRETPRDYLVTRLLHSVRNFFICGFSIICRLNSQSHRVHDFLIVKRLNNKWTDESSQKATRTFFPSPSSADESHRANKISKLHVTDKLRSTKRTASSDCELPNGIFHCQQNERLLVRFRSSSDPIICDIRHVLSSFYVRPPDTAVQIV